jgi:hypothetical protein
MKKRPAMKCNARRFEGACSAPDQQKFYAATALWPSIRGCALPAPATPAATVAFALAARAFTGFAGQHVAHSFDDGVTFALAPRAFTGFASQHVAHGFDDGVTLAFTAWAFAGLSGKTGGGGAGTNGENGGGHGNFVELDHDDLLKKVE